MSYFLINNCSSCLIFLSTTVLHVFCSHQQLFFMSYVLINNCSSCLIFLSTTVLHVLCSHQQLFFMSYIFSSTTVLHVLFSVHIKGKVNLRQVLLFHRFCRPLFKKFKHLEVYTVKGRI